MATPPDTAVPAERSQAPDTSSVERQLDEISERLDYIRRYIGPAK